MLKRVEKSDTTRDDQVLNTMEKLIDFILSIMLFVLAIVFTFGAKSSIALYSTGLGSIFVVMISYSSRHIFKNGISGVVIFAKDILRIGGSITYNGSKGEIKEVELGHIILQKDSGTTIRIPSAGILENGFSNHMKIDRNGFNFQIPIEKNRSKIDQALKSIESLLTKKSKDWNILDNTVEVVVTKIGLNSVTIEASFDTSVMEFDRQVDSSKEKISKDLEQEKKIHKEFIIKIIELNL